MLALICAWMDDSRNQFLNTISQNDEDFLTVNFSSSLKTIDHAGGRGSKATLQSLGSLNTPSIQKLAKKNLNSLHGRSPSVQMPSNSLDPLVMDKRSASSFKSRP